VNGRSSMSGHSHERGDPRDRIARTDDSTPATWPAWWRGAGVSVLAVVSRPPRTGLGRASIFSAASSRKCAATWLEMSRVVPIVRFPCGPPSRLGSRVGAIPAPRRPLGIEQSSRAHARQTHAAWLHGSRRHCLTLQRPFSRSKAHSAAQAGGHWQTSGWVCTAEVRGSTPLRSTRYLQGNRALRALRETFRKPLCNHPMLPKFGGTDGTGSDSSRLAGTDQCSEAVQLSRQSRVSRGTLSRHLRPHFADLRACTPIPIVSAVDGTSRRRPADHSDFGRAVREGSARLRAVPWPRGQTSRNAATTAGSNWLPALLRNSFWAAAWLSAGR